MTVQWLSEAQFSDLKRKCYKIGRIKREECTAHRMSKERYAAWKKAAMEVDEDRPIREQM